MYNLLRGKAKEKYEEFKKLYSEIMESDFMKRRSYGHLIYHICNEINITRSDFIKYEKAYQEELYYDNC